MDNSLNNFGSPGANICGHSCGFVILWGARWSPRDFSLDLSPDFPDSSGLGVFTVLEASLSWTSCNSSCNRFISSSCESMWSWSLSWSSRLDWGGEAAVRQTVAKALTAELFQIVQESMLERVSASLDDLLTVEASLTNLCKQLSACLHLDWMLASLHVGRREAEIANRKKDTTKRLTKAIN